MLFRECHFSSLVEGAGCEGTSIKPVRAPLVISFCVRTGCQYGLMVLCSQAISPHVNYLCGEIILCSLNRCDAVAWMHQTG